MNKDRRNRIAQIINAIEKAKDTLQDVLREEENVFDNMPENLQCSMRGEESESAIEYMEEAVEALENAIEQLEEI